MLRERPRRTTSASGSPCRMGSEFVNAEGRPAQRANPDKVDLRLDLSSAYAQSRSGGRGGGTPEARLRVHGVSANQAFGVRPPTNVHILGHLAKHLVGSMARVIDEVRDGPHECHRAGRGSADRHRGRRGMRHLDSGATSGLGGTGAPKTGWSARAVGPSCTSAEPVSSAAGGHSPSSRCVGVSTFRTTSSTTGSIALARLVAN